MSDWPDDISKEAWSVGCGIWAKLEREHPTFDAEIAVIARVIDQARREGYAAGVRAAAENVETLGVCQELDVLIWNGGAGFSKHTLSLAAQIRALDVKWGGE